MSYSIISFVVCVSSGVFILTKSTKEVGTREWNLNEIAHLADLGVKPTDRGITFQNGRVSDIIRNYLSTAEDSTCESGHEGG